MEIWKIIEGFENYEVSNLGNVRNKVKIMKLHDNGKGYLKVRLTNSKGSKYFYVHRLVLITFSGHEENKVVDHINGIRKDNRLENLRWLANIDNTIRGGKKETASKLRGVAKDGNRWRSTITIKGKRKFLGRFDTEIEAHEAYMKEYNRLKNEA